MAFKGNKTAARGKDTSDTARKSKSNPLLYAGSVLILILVIVAFVGGDLLSGAGSGGEDLTFGYYDKVPINYAQVGPYMADFMRDPRNNVNDDNYYFYMRRSFELAAAHTAILQEMKRAGYAAPSKVVDREMAKLPHFRENGRFSASLYRQMDESRRMSLWRQVQEEITRNHYINDTTGLLKTKAEAEFLGSMASVERSFEMAVFSVRDFPDSEYESFAAEHADLFRTIHLSMITINSSERDAKNILASIIEGETAFEDAAMAHSKDAYADRGGDMGSKLMHELNWDIPDETVRDTLIALHTGEYSDVFRLNDSWVFFRVEETVQDADLSDEAVMGKVREYVRSYERGRMEDWAIERAEEFIALADEIGFEEAMAQHEMESRSFGPIPLNYGNVDLFTSLASQSVQELSASAANDRFWSVAFATPVATPSTPVVQGDNVLVLFPTDETEADASDIESIVSYVSSYWLDDNINQSLMQYLLNNPKMDDRFMDVYFRYFMGN